MFLFEMVEDGPRGLPMFMEPVDEYVNDIASYRVDWVNVKHTSHWSPQIFHITHCCYEH
jgi:hypothetical protein